MVVHLIQDMKNVKEEIRKIALANESDEKLKFELLRVDTNINRVLSKLYKIEKTYK